MKTNFSKEIIKLRIDNDMTQGLLGERIGLSIAHISAIERGVRFITNSVLKKLLSVFRLKKAEKEKLTLMALAARPTVVIDISHASAAKKEMMAKLAMKFNVLKPKDVKAINKILGGMPK